MSFERYPSLNKFGNVEVEGIECGKVYVFPKLDGANASMWIDKEHMDGRFGYGSRNRRLTLDNDNAAFMATMVDEYGDKYRQMLLDHPNFRLFGEWLVPHTIRDYVDEAWRKFYVFDVFNEETLRFLTYDQYKPLMVKYELDFIPCVKIIKNATIDQLLHEAKADRFLLKGDAPTSEGIVIKNYEWENKFKRQTWAKIVNAEFKYDNLKLFGTPEVGGDVPEQIIVTKAVTIALLDKEIAKITLEEGGWTSKAIPRLLETVFYCLVTEELYSRWKEVKYASINGKALKNFTIARIKELKPELF